MIELTLQETIEVIGEMATHLHRDYPAAGRAALAKIAQGGVDAATAELESESTSEWAQAAHDQFAAIATAAKSGMMPELRVACANIRYVMQRTHGMSGHNREMEAAKGA